MPAPSKPSFPNWTEQPLFFAALLFSAGIILGGSLFMPARHWILLVFVLLVGVLAACARKRSYAGLLALAVFVPLGGLGSAFESTARPTRPDISRFTGESMEIVAHVTATHLPRFDPSDRELRIVEVVTERIGDGTETWKEEIGVRLTIHDNGKGIPDLQYGDRFRFVARLREPWNYGNPGALDYRGYLERKGIIALASVPSTSIEMLPGKIGTRWGSSRAAIRASVIDHISSLAQEPCTSWYCMSREDVGVLLAMIIGEQSLLERATKVDFQKTGAFHILVVSGMNVGIVALVVFGICRKLHASQIFATIATIVLALFYAYLTDMGAPILRAVLMLVLYLCARLLYRERYSLNSIGTAALILLMISPASLFDPSFQLTFLSVAALGGIVQPLLARSLTPYAQALRQVNLVGIDTSLASDKAQLRLDIRLLANKFTQILAVDQAARIATSISWALRAGVAFAELVTVTVVLQVALALPMVWYFHRLTIVGVPVNVLVVPLTSLLMPLGIGATIASYLWMPLAKWLTAVTALVLHAITGTVTWLADAPRVDLRTPTPGLTIAVIAAGVFLISLFAFKQRRVLALTAASALTISAALLTFPMQPRFRYDAAEVTAIDVGQGDSLLIVDPSGRTMLVDGGGPPGFAQSNSFDVGEDVVSPYLWSRGISRLDVVMLTHPHSDHMDGLRAVLRNFRPRELWLGASDQGELPLLAIATQVSTAVRHLHGGERTQLGELRFTVLSAGENFSESLNDDSVVLKLQYRNSTALFLGDAEQALESQIAAQSGPVDLLKVAHHGSATSTTPGLLRATHPKFAVISVGTNNAYGHPRGEVLARLRAARILTYRTDLNGATTFYLNGGTISSESFLKTTPMLPERPGLQPVDSRDTPR